MRIEGGEHALDGRLSRFLVIDVAGIIAGDGGDCFVVVFFDLVGDAIGIFVVRGAETTEFSAAANRAAKDGSYRNYERRFEDKLPVQPRFVVSG